MKGEQGFGDSITASIDCPATAGRSRQAQLLGIINGLRAKCVAQGAKHSQGQCKSRDVFRLPNIDTQPSCLALRNTNKCLRNSCPTRRVLLNESIIFETVVSGVSCNSGVESGAAADARVCPIDHCFADFPSRR